METWKTILVVSIILGALGWAGHGDAIDEQKQHNVYCEHVFGPNPIWPDYKNIGPEGCQEKLR